MSADEAVAALRAAADLIERLPDTIDHLWLVSAETFNLSGEDLAAAVHVGGTWEKDVAGVDGELFELRQGIVELHANREEVCTAVPTGRTTTVKRVVAPAVVENVEVPEVRWECAPLLTKGLP
jgi:hypothetical protein